jgi:hypothetical protein
MILFHSTWPEAARQILLEGFHDPAGVCPGGVLFSSVPPGGEGVVLRVRFRLPVQYMAGYEWKENGRGHRTWIIPAVVVNGRAQILLHTIGPCDGKWQGRQADEIRRFVLGEGIENHHPCLSDSS